MILSRQQIEEMGAAITQDFNEFFFQNGTAHQRSFVQATPIDQFARDYLGLHIEFADLSSDGSICGLTCYADVEYVINGKNGSHTVMLRQNQVLLDSSFIERGQIRRLCGKRRFTLAHECAHQILFQLESEETKLQFRRMYAERKNCSLRDLKTREDWNEWQANALGAALLMPQAEVARAMWLFSPHRKLSNENGKFSYVDMQTLYCFCQAFGVSKSAAMIRLRQLGFLEDRIDTECIKPEEVFA